MLEPILTGKPAVKEWIEPEYYKDFHCLAADCRNDCCHGWGINVPRHCYMKLRSAPKSAALDGLVRAAIVRSRKAKSPQFFAMMRLNQNGDCLFLDENRLCSLQIECGHGILPDICREFPRHVVLRGRIVERSCTPACEEIVNALFRAPGGVRFESAPLLKGSVRGCNIRTPEGCETIYERFLEIQTLTVGILQNRAYPLDGRVLLLGVALEELQKLERTKDPGAVAAWLQKYAGFTAGNHFAAALEKFPKNAKLFLSSNIDAIRTMPYMTNPEHASVLVRLLENMQVKGEGCQFTFDTARYDELSALLSEALGEEDYIIENVMVNEWFHQGSPLDGENGVWTNYVRFCMLYSMFKFMLAGGMTPGTGREDIVQMIVEWARMLLHSSRRVGELVLQFQGSGSDTLAHMAVLVNG